MSLKQVSDTFAKIASLLNTAVDLEADTQPIATVVPMPAQIKLGDVILTTRGQWGYVIGINERTGWIRYQHLYRMTTTGTLIPVDGKVSCAPPRDCAAQS